MRDYRKKISILSDTPPITESDRVSILAKIANSKTLSEHLRHMSLEEVQKGFILELEGRQRMYIIHRLESRTRSLKLKAWNAELAESLYVDK